MSNKIQWDSPYKDPRKNKVSISESIQKQHAQLDQQQAARDALSKAMPPMKALLSVRMQNRTPLQVMRPLAYASSGLEGELEDDGFYTVKKSEAALGKFIDQRVVIPRGEHLIFKSVYNPMREFIFEDSKGTEHAISFDQANLLLTQTNIYEDVQEFLTSNPS